MLYIRIYLIISIKHAVAAALAALAILKAQIIEKK